MFTNALNSVFCSSSAASQMDLDLSAACGVKDTTVENHWNVLKNVPPLGQFIFSLKHSGRDGEGAEHANVKAHPAGMMTNACSLSERLMYDIATHSATPIHSNITQILRLDRQPTAARRASTDHDPTGSIAVPFSRARRRSQWRQLLSAGKDLRPAGPGLSRISARTITTRGDEAYRLFALPGLYAQRLLSGIVDQRTAANPRQGRFPSDGNVPMKSSCLNAI